LKKTKQKKEKAHNKTRCLYAYRCAGGAATQVLKLAHDIDLTVPREGPGKAQGFPSFFFSFPRCVKKFRGSNHLEHSSAILTQFVCVMPDGRTTVRHGTEGRPPAQHGVTLDTERATSPVEIQLDAPLLHSVDSAV
jgi:hypothetical protein